MTFALVSFALNTQQTMVLCFELGQILCNVVTRERGDFTPRDTTQDWQETAGRDDVRLKAVVVDDLCTLVAGLRSDAVHDRCRRVRWQGGGDDKRTGPRQTEFVHCRRRVVKPDAVVDVVVVTAHAGGGRFAGLDLASGGTGR
ncbi:hypothetical protein Bbelb_187060 [Branchiostoma belcheri]|nr:hypothetical protein Bbelb_187060 [Branchiostoma belcheri]